MTTCSFTRRRVPTGATIATEYRVMRKTARQYRNPNDDPRGPWRAVPLSAQGYRKNQMYTIIGPDGKPHDPPKGRCWGMLREAL